MPSPSVSPLNTGQVAHLRSPMGKRPGFDVSPGGKYSAEVGKERGKVILTDLATGTAQSLPLGMATDEVTVSDRGDIVVSFPELDRETYLAEWCLGRLQPDGEVRKLPISTESWKGARNPELSSDGTRLAYTDADRSPSGNVAYIYMDGPEGHLRAPLPHPVKSNEFQEDGRLLVLTEAIRNEVRIPTYYLVDPTGKVEEVADVAAAEALGGPVRARLAEAWAASIPGATAGQCQQLVDLFGYRLPERAHSEGKSSLFWAPPGEDGQPFGLYGLRHGQGAPRPALSEADTAAVGAGRPDEVGWRPGQRGAALVFDRSLVIVDFEGSSRALPGVVERTGPGDTTPLEWSRDGRWLAVEMVKDGGRSGVDVYDTETGDFFPVAPDARLKGWSEGDVLVESGGETRSVHLGTLNQDALREQLMGTPLQASGEILVGEGDVRIGGISLPLREGR